MESATEKFLSLLPLILQEIFPNAPMACFILKVKQRHYTIVFFVKKINLSK